MSHHIKPTNSVNLNSVKANHGTLVEVTPASAKWHNLGFKVARLEAGQTLNVSTDTNEIAVVPLQGEVNLSVAGQSFELSRKGVFEEVPHVLYIPPRHQLTIEAKTDLEIAWGSAPAEGKYPLRLFRPDEMKKEVRGGGSARRQVNHILNHPLPAERLILFEVYVPGGSWSGYPPHCHDGKFGSPYLEETYYYRVSPENGFAIHRNYDIDTDFDELFTVKNGDLVLVTKGFHPVSAAPGSNIYFLNFLAGDLLNEARGTPPYDDPNFAWIKNDWEAKPIPLPLLK
jgi:5-deoxy-glucuronate isomerase